MKLRELFSHPVQTILCYVFVLCRKQLVINLRQYSGEFYDQENTFSHAFFEGCFYKAQNIPWQK